MKVMPLPEILHPNSGEKHSIGDEIGDKESKKAEVDGQKHQNDESDCEVMIINDNDSSEQQTATAAKFTATIETEPRVESSFVEIEEVTTHTPDKRKQDVEALCPNASFTLQSVSDFSDRSIEPSLQISSNLFHLVVLPSAGIYQSESECSGDTEQKTPIQIKSVATIENGPSAESPFAKPEEVATCSQEDSEDVEVLCEKSSVSVQPVSDCSAMFNQAALQISSNIIQFIPLPFSNIYQQESHHPETVTKAINDSIVGAALNICNPSLSLGQSIIERPIRVSQVVSYSSAGVTEFPCSLSDNTSHLSIATVQSVADSSVITECPIASSSRQEPHSVPPSSVEIVELLPDSPEELEQCERNSSKKIAQSVEIDQKRQPSVSNSTPKLKSSLANKLGNSDSAGVLPTSRALTKLLQNPSISIVEKPCDGETIKRERQHNPRNSSLKTENNSTAQQTGEMKYAKNKHKEILQKLLVGGTTEKDKKKPQIYPVPWSKEKLQENKSITVNEKTWTPISQCATVEPFCIVGDTTLMVKKAVTETKLDRLKSVHVEKLSKTPGSSRRQTESLDSTDEIIVDERSEEQIPSRESGTNKSAIPASRKKNVELGERQNQKQSNVPIRAFLANSPTDLAREMRNKWRSECAICKERFVDNCELHRHVTLSHPGIRIVFCELCGSSFRSDKELIQHRSFHHKRPEKKNETSNFTKIQSRTTTNTKISSHRAKKSTRNFNESRLKNRDNSTSDRKPNVESVASHSYANEHIRTRMAKKKVAWSSVRTRNSNKFSQSGTSLSGNKRETLRTKRMAQKSVYHYIDVDVMKHKAIATQTQFRSAEIKKLVVELTRLGEPGLEKYLTKSDPDSTSGFVLTRFKKFRRSSTGSSNRTAAKHSSESDTGRTRRIRGFSKNIAEEKNVKITDVSKVAKRELLDDRVVANRRRSTRFRQGKRGIYKEFEESSDDDSAESLWLRCDQKWKRNVESINRQKSSKSEKMNSEEEVSLSEESTPLEPEKTKKVSETLKKEQIVEKCVSTPSVASSSTMDNKTSSLSLENTSSIEDPELSTKTLHSCNERLSSEETKSDRSSYSLQKSSADKRASKNSNKEAETSDDKESNVVKNEEEDSKSIDKKEQSKENIHAANNQLEEEKSENRKQTEESLDDNEKQENPDVNDEKEQSHDIETNRNKDNDSVLSEKNKFDSEENNKREKSNDNVENQSKEKNLQDTDNSAEKTQLEDKSKDNSEVSENVIDDITRLQPENTTKIEKLQQTNDSRSKEVSNEQCDTAIQKTHTSDAVLIKISKQPCQRAIKDVTIPDDNLCLVCEELTVLMEEVSRKVRERRTSGKPMKCLFCKRYFITMFHLELHIAKNHLRCKKKVPCNRSRPSKDDKSSRNNELDRKTKVEVPIECGKCAMEFIFKDDLKKHMIIHDESKFPKETSSHESQEHLKESTVPSKNEEISNSQVNSNSTLDNSSSEGRTSTTPRVSTLDCSRCSAKFLKTTEYVRHVREAHGTSQISSVSKQKNDPKKSGNDDRLLNKEDSIQEISSTNIVDKICKPPRPKISRPVRSIRISDREDPFKQYLLNVAKDTDTEIVIVKRKRGRPRKIKEETIEEPIPENLIEEPEDNNVLDFLSNYHTCKICQKKFRRAQDLLIHRMHHDDEDTSKSDDKDADFSQDETSNRDQESVIDSVFDSMNIIQNSPSTREVEFPPTGRDVADDVGNFKDCDSEKVELDSRKRGASQSNVSPEALTVEKRRKIETTKSSQAESAELTEVELGDMKMDTIEDLKPTEIRPNHRKNKKLPIACNKCNRHFANQSALNEHLFFLHDDSLKDTVLTDVLTPIGESKRSDHSDTPQNWQCETCLQNFKLYQGYSRHRYFAHGDDSMVHVCDNCSKVLTNVTMVNVHICTDMASYNCRACKQTFPTGMSLRLHNTEKHMETNGQHLCKRCDRKFLTKAMLKRHVKSKICFTRRYRARKRSPVRMATPDTTNNEESEKTTSPKVADDGNDPSKERDSERDQIADKEMDSMVSSDRPQRLSSWRSDSNEEIARDESSGKRKIASTNSVPVKRERRRARKHLLSDEEKSSYQTSDDEHDKEIENTTASLQTVLHIDETEIHQCSFCQIYCLSITTLRNHMAQIHSATDQICQICYKVYPAGKLIRHLMEYHITSEDGYVPRSKTSWKFGVNSNELDTDVFIKMLGMPRLASLCEYRRYAGKSDFTRYPCFYCGKKSTTGELYRYHLLLHHDTMCALCNIEFKTGKDAAKHKGEVHGSVSSYIWFADRTIMALTATKNYTDITDSILIHTLSRDVKVDNSAAEEHQDDLPDENTTNINLIEHSTSDNTGKNIATITSGEEIVGTITSENETTCVEDNEFLLRVETTDYLEGKKNVEETIPAEYTVDRANNKEARTFAESPKASNEEIRNVTIQPDENADSSIAQIPCVSSEDKIVKNEDSAEPEDVILIIVVTDEDLQSFNIGNKYPNIWGLAAKISSTSETITPSEVKAILERYFERPEDLDMIGLNV